MVKLAQIFLQRRIRAAAKEAERLRAERFAELREDSIKQVVELICQERRRWWKKYYDIVMDTDWEHVVIEERPRLKQRTWDPFTRKCKYVSYDMNVYATLIRIKPYFWIPGKWYKSDLEMHDPSRLSPKKVIRFEKLMETGVYDDAAGALKRNSYTTIMAEYDYVVKRSILCLNQELKKYGRIDNTTIFSCDPYSWEYYHKLKTRAVW